MALYYTGILCPLYGKWLYRITKICSYSIQKLVVETNPLDNFTNQLMQDKLYKWNKIAPKKHEIPMIEKEIEEDKYESNFETLTSEEINNLFKEAKLNEDNARLINLMKECIFHKQCPSLTNITSVLSLCAQKGNKSLIFKIVELCNEQQPQLLVANSYFKHYLAQTIWLNGNIPESLRLLEEVYTSNNFLRCKIRLILKDLISDAVNTKSGAAVINIKNFAITFSVKYGDFFPLLCVWQDCILSEWFTDQEFALDLLDHNGGLREAVINKFQYVAVISVFHHRTEVVYRLLEILLKYDMKLQYNGVLLVLLDYQSKHTLFIKYLKL